MRLCAARPLRYIPRHDFGLETSVKSIPLFFCGFVFVFFLANPAVAQDTVFHFGVGGRGGVNVNLLSEPSEETLNLPVPGFVGFGGGGGFAVQGHYADIVGLETGLLFISTSGSGEINFRAAGVDVDEEISTTELHLPLLLKLQLPLESAKPYLGIGATFVFQTDAEFTIDQTYIVNPIDTTIELLSYTMLTFSLGVAIDLGVVRIPVEFRANYQSLDDDPLERTTYDSSGSTLTALGVLPNWEGQVFFLVGVDYSLVVTDQPEGETPE